MYSETFMGLILKVITDWEIKGHLGDLLFVILIVAILVMQFISTCCNDNSAK